MGGKGTKLRTGRTLVPATVTRVVDANVVHLEQEIPPNGSYRIFLFAGQPKRMGQAIKDFAANLRKKSSFFSAYQRSDIDKVSFHEKYNPHSHLYSFATVFNAKRQEVEIATLLPAELARYKDNVYADDIWDQRVPEAQAA